MKWCPSLLNDYKWDCAESVELTKWTKTLVNRHGKLPASAIEIGSEVPLREVLCSTDVIRHTAVHRLSTTAQGIHKMITSASRLAKTLGDRLRAAELENLCFEVENRIRDMELNKNFLENRLDKQLQEICEQRAELDRKEKEIMAKTVQEDQENKVLVGSFLEAAVKKIFGRRDPGYRDSANMTNSEYETNETPKTSSWWSLEGLLGLDLFGLNSEH